MPFKRTYSIFADYFQFYLHDSRADCSEAEALAKELGAKGLAAAQSFVAVLTQRNYTVRVEVVILDDEHPPSHPDDAWDSVAECSINVPSGLLVLRGCTDPDERAHRIPVRPDSYRVRAYFGGLDSLRSQLEGDDHYLVVLWPGEALQTRVLKPWKPKTKI